MGVYWARENGYIIPVFSGKPCLALKAAASYAVRGMVANPALGYNMAKNLHAKIPSTDTLMVRDVNEESTALFLRETMESAKGAGAGGTFPEVVVADNARALAEKSVSCSRKLSFL